MNTFLRPDIVMNTQHPDYFNPVGVGGTMTPEALYWVSCPSYLDVTPKFPFTPEKVDVAYPFSTTRVSVPYLPTVVATQ